MGAEPVLLIPKTGFATESQLGVLLHFHGSAPQLMYVGDQSIVLDRMGLDTISELRRRTSVLVYERDSEEATTAEQTLDGIVYEARIVI